MLRQISLFVVFLAALWPVVASASPVTGTDGVLRYPFGERTPATLRCEPLFVCDLVLEPGESIVNVAVGDSLRWLIAPASSGATDIATPHVLVKPTEAGLHTNLIVTTSRRTYYLALVSSYGNPMPRIGFLYPQDPQQAFATASVGRTTRQDMSLPVTAIDKLDFNYRLTGERSLQPVRAFNDGAHTYLQMPLGMSDVPVLFAVGSEGGDTLVNYRFTGQYYVVDGVPASIALVVGSDKHQRRALVTRGG
jgi:type IV secretion system protein TrbG